MDKTCEWFANCQNPSIGIIEHPTIGDVEICHDHYDWLTVDFSPTKMVPPMVARKIAALA